MSESAERCGPRPLPLAGEQGARAPRVRESTSGRKRALVLIAVQLLLALHIGHWLATGSSLSPLEPSESMEFSKRGVVNAGLIFFLLTIGSTLVLGRWFCGWACHVVALQDLCRWLMLKAGVTPRPLRSRVLLLVPVLAFLYMFVAPLVQRAWLGDDLGVRATHLTTETFWATFPTWPVALATLAVCGFAAVYFLGSKGFCTYGCPYGAIYGLVDHLAPGRIRVSDACNSCGHCTSVCSSNVIVHQEVRDYGMVVDPGCMKCLDCVSVCPNDALRFGFGRPAVLKQRTERFQPSRRKPAFSRGEEVSLALLFLLAFLAFRGLYGLVPFLFALGLAGIVAWLYLLGLRLLRRPSVKLLRTHLKKHGRLTPPGVSFAVALVLFAALWAHSGLVQYHGWRAQALHDESGEIRPSWSAQLKSPAQLDGPQAALVAAALDHARLVDTLSLVRDTQNDLRLAWLHLLRGEDAEVVRRVRRAIEAFPERASLRFDLANYFVSRQEGEKAITQYRAAIRIQPHDAAGARRNLAQLLIQGGDPAEAAAEYRRAIASDPNQARLHYELAVLDAQRGRGREALDGFRAALRLQPSLQAARQNLLGALQVAFRRERHADVLREGAKLAEILPDDAELNRLLGRSAILSAKYELAERYFARSLKKERDPLALHALALLAKKKGDTAKAQRLMQEALRLQQAKRGQ